MTRCLACFANVTNLSLIPVIQSHAKVCSIQTAWEMSTYGATLDYLKRTVPRVHASEFFEGMASGSRVDGILNQDVHDLSFEDCSLDLITSNQVFEHVRDDLQGFAECHRVLKPGGALIFSVPLYDTSATRQLAVVQDGRLQHLFPPEYHDSRRDGPESALCYWRHSFQDIAERVSSAGFRARLVEIRFPASLKESTFVVYALKD
jgi:SAM-dependent methyltransferase